MEAPVTAIARCLPLALFVTPVDREPHVNAFADERPAWAPFHAF